MNSEATQKSKQLNPSFEREKNCSYEAEPIDSSIDHLCDVPRIFHDTQAPKQAVIGTKEDGFVSKILGKIRGKIQADVKNRI